jgi:hypothetical protein
MDERAKHLPSGRNGTKSFGKKARKRKLERGGAAIVSRTRDSTHVLATKNIELFAKTVLPALRRE